MLLPRIRTSLTATRSTSSLGTSPFPRSTVSFRSNPSSSNPSRQPRCLGISSGRSHSTATPPRNPSTPPRRTIAYPKSTTYNQTFLPKARSSRTPSPDPPPPPTKSELSTKKPSPPSKSRSKVKLRSSSSNAKSSIVTFEPPPFPRARPRLDSAPSSIITLEPLPVLRPCPDSDPFPPLPPPLLSLSSSSKRPSRPPRTKTLPPEASRLPSKRIRRFRPPHPRGALSPRDPASPAHPNGDRDFLPRKLSPQEPLSARSSALPSSLSHSTLPSDVVSSASSPSLDSDIDSLRPSPARPSTSAPSGTYPWARSPRHTDILSYLASQQPPGLTPYPFNSPPEAVVLTGLKPGTTDVEVLLFMREELGVGAVDASVVDEREVKEGRRLGQWKELGDVRVGDEKGKGVKALVDFGIGDGAKLWKKRTLDLEIELRANPHPFLSSSFQMREFEGSSNEFGEPTDFDSLDDGRKHDIYISNLPDVYDFRDIYSLCRNTFAAKYNVFPEHVNIVEADMDPKDIWSLVKPDGPADVRQRTPFPVWAVHASKEVLKLHGLRILGRRIFVSTSPPPSLPASYHTLRWPHPPKQLSIEERQEQRILSALAYPFGRRYIQRKMSHEAFKTLDVNTREQVAKIVKDRKDKAAKKALRRPRASRKMRGSEDEVGGRRVIDSHDEGGRDKSGRS